MNIRKQELEKELKEAKKEIKELKNENEMSKAENEALKKKIEKLEQSKPSGSADEEEEESSDDEDSVADANDPFGARIQELRAFRQANGHCKVPRSFQTLGKWVNNQRVRIKKLSQEKIDKLDSLGFDWGKNHVPPKPWETTFAEIKEHKETFGSFNFAPSGALGKWSSIQRKEFKRAKHGKDSILTVN
jgi:chromosome segregation ATPase